MENIDINFVHKLVDASGDSIRKHFRNLDKIDTKSDTSPVTIADREAEEILRRLIKETYPSHGIQGEEFGTENGDAEYLWVIDPIDGTLSFMIGRPTFCTMVALMYRGEPVLSVLDQPITRERWIAYKGQGASLNGKPIRTRACARLEDAVLGCTSTEYYSPEQAPRFQNLFDATKHTVFGGDCYLYALVANGTLDLAVDAGLKAHDFLPIIPLITEAGGVITDWQGRALHKDSAGDVVIAGDKRVHEAAVRILESQSRRVEESKG